MEKYNCLIVEDEPLAAEILEDYVKKIPFLQLKGICNDAIFAMDVLQKDKIDLLFLDIHLPHLKGVDFIRTLKNAPQVIITTAYRDYAIEGYELNVLDYLVKPINFNRFLAAVNKVKNHNSTGETVTHTISSAERSHLFFNVNKKNVKVYIDDILYIESLKEYIRITTKGKTILTKMQMGQIEEMLSDKNFLRIHRSFLVSKPKIEAFNATDVEINNQLIPIGRSYKELVFSVLGDGI